MLKKKKVKLALGLANGERLQEFQVVGLSW